MSAHRPPCVVPASWALTVVAVLMTPVGADAQMRAAVPGSDFAWPDVPPPPRITGGATEARFWLPAPTIETAGPHQERPLPVYDDAGNVIRLSEIQAEVDPSGLKGAFWGALLGVTAGSAIGHAAAPGECEYVSGGYRYYCSPREEALNSALPAGFAIALGAIGAWIGWEADRMTFDEALERIRARRREPAR